MSPTLLAALIGVLMLASGPAHAAGTASPGKSSAYGSVDGVAITAPQSQPVTIQIEKGKKKTVLEIDATAVGLLPSGDYLGITVRVNGNTALPVEPDADPFVFAKCPGTYRCMAHAVYWLDLDAAEAAFPGTIIGQNLDISAVVQAFPGTVTDGTVSLRARLHKK